MPKLDKRDKHTAMEFVLHALSIADRQVDAGKKCAIQRPVWVYVSATVSRGNKYCLTPLLPPLRSPQVPFS
jgi:hypothetical protein